MNLQLMKYFLLVVEERSISKGATKAHISQSALSQMIQKYEDEIGKPLLERSNRGVVLTEAGEIVAKYANSIIKKYDQMLESLSSISDGQNQININGTYSMAAYSLPCLLYKLKKKFPQHKYALEARAGNDILRDIREGLTDFGFVDGIDPASDDLTFYPMGREHVVLIAPADYAIPNVIDLEDLFDYEMILCSMNKNTCNRLEHELDHSSKSFKDLNVIFNADSLSAVKSSVVSGYGISFAPYESIKRELYEKLIKIITVEHLDMDYDIFLVTRKSHDIGQPHQSILKYLLEAGVSIFC
ncbi:MAG: LysR family transcriptional regulator [Eubacteriales bacterium]|nr:LysR family transcriptional regulator [Eubacteriales bacterium]